MQKHFQNPIIHRLSLAIFLVASLGSIHYAFPDLIGIDGYFHIRYSYLLRTEGLIDTFPWLSATLYAQNFVDDHFFFHVLQTPFTFGDLTFGAKIYGLIVATGIFLLFHHILVIHRIPYATVWTLTLLVSSPIFLLRISMPRAPGVSLFFLLLALHLLLRHKDRWLGVLAFFYVWTYGGFPLLWVLVGCVYIVSLIYQKNNRWPLLLATGLGTVLGLIINPYFPDNLHFLYLSYTKIELGMFPSTIPAGTEDYPYAASTAVKHTFLIWGVLFVTILIYIARPFALKADAMTLFLFSVALLCLYLNVRRFIEYWPPFALLFSAFATRKMKSQIDNFKPMVIQSSIAVILVFASINTIREIRQIRDHEHVPQFYAGASEYLQKNTQKNSIVFTGGWDDFPILFFYNTYNYYIVGLGLHYLYFYDPDLFMRWMDITDGLISNPAEAIKQSFGAQYAFCLKADAALLRKLEADPQARLLYADDHASVFELVPTP